MNHKHQPASSTNGYSAPITCLVHLAEPALAQQTHQLIAIIKQQRSREGGALFVSEAVKGLDMEGLADLFRG